MAINWTTAQNSLKAARELDIHEALPSFRDEFVFPKASNGDPQLYFAGHSLGLMPRQAPQYVQDEMQAWGEFGVEGHFKGRHPWLPYHENVTASLARLVGAKESEVVAMNSLTANLHLMLASFYRPTKSRFKILIENNAFPSDRYAVDSQAKWHGFQPQEAVVELRPRPGETTVRAGDILEQVASLGDSLAVIMLGNCNYLSGQAFPMKEIVEAGHAVGAKVGFNLAHGAGNLDLRLHDGGADFAVWCSYKYLNAGPGGIAGAFVHERHHQDKNLPRLAGWWGHDKSSRFKMGPQFQPIPSAEAWQLSNPPIFQLASLRASLELFDKAGIENLRAKGERLTSYFEFLLKTHLGEGVEIVTPGSQERGSMLCLRVRGVPRSIAESLHSHGAVLDFREPDILRATPAPLYNTFEDIFRLVQILTQILKGRSA